MKRFLLTIFLTTISFLIFSQGINFEKDSSLNEIISKSKGTNKLIFINCFNTWCDLCNDLSSKIYVQKEVGDFYNNNFVNFNINLTSHNGEQIMLKYKIVGFPTLLFLNSNGEVIHNYIGMGNANKIINQAKIALLGVQRLIDLKTKIINKDTSYEAIFAYLSSCPDAKDKDSILEKYFKVLQDTDRFNNKSWTLFFNFVQDLNNSQFSFVLKHRAFFEKKYSQPKIESKIFQCFDYSYDKFNSDSAKTGEFKILDSAIFYTSKSNIYHIFCLVDNKNKWSLYLEKVRKYVSLGNIDPIELSLVCRNIFSNYKKYDDTIGFKDAFLWSKLAYNLSPDLSLTNDIYAHFLFDSGLIQEAISLEEIAISKGKIEKSVDLDLYINDLEQFKKAKIKSSR